MEDQKGYHPIGVFDSGFGGLTILKDIVKELPEYDYLYLGDNARAPYGTRSFDAVYHYTLECVKHLFSRGCNLVILACNTASAKALRTIQQNDLPKIAPGKKVLGVIRPTTEVAGSFTKSGYLGLLATPGTVSSDSYTVEIAKFFPEIKLLQQACPMWVPLIENNDWNSPGAEYFIEKDIQELLKRSDKIDAVILGCTHYPLIEQKIRKFLPSSIRIIRQGNLIAKGLKDYLKRHPEIEKRCSRSGNVSFLTTDLPEVFDAKAALFYGSNVRSSRVQL